MADDFDINRIDEVIHGRIRLGVMAYLSGADAADFNELKQKLQTRARICDCGLAAAYARKRPSAATTRAVSPIASAPRSTRSIAPEKTQG